MCCRATLWNINARTQGINNKLQSSVDTYLRCGGVVNKQINKRLLLTAESITEKNKIGK